MQESLNHWINEKRGLTLREQTRKNNCMELDKNSIRV